MGLELVARGLAVLFCSVADGEKDAQSSGPAVEPVTDELGQVLGRSHLDDGPIGVGGIRVRFDSHPVEVR
jgi:hypothetical protein